MTTDEMDHTKFDVTATEFWYDGDSEFEEELEKCEEIRKTLMGE